ncbi:signal peptidase I [Candidatus Merdisoma sp. KK006]|jgi:signal peptidase I
MGRKGKEVEDDFIGEGDEEREKGPLRELLGMILYIGIVLVITFLIITFVGQRTHVSGDSMKNTLNHGDQLIVDKITYRFRDPVRFDIIVFPYKYEENTYYIKRIIGLPGETVQIADGEIYINGEVLKESYGREVIQDPGMAAEPIELGEDEYFVLGDNRNASSDSREPSVGVIYGEDIVGRAWIRIWPLNKAGILKHQ